MITHDITREEKRRARAKEPVVSPGAGGEETAPQLLIFTITMVYSTMAPLIILFGMVYFALSYVISKYNFLHVWKKEYESG